MKELTWEEVRTIVTEMFEDSDPRPALEQIQGWLDRGDGVAVYRNEDFGHRELGRVQLVSFGSPAAQLEVDEPPARLPDIGNVINWRYVLVGTHRREG